MEYFNYDKWTLFIFLFVFSGFSLQAQKPGKPIKQKVTKVRGVVIDADTKELIPFANIAFVGTTVGTSTDFDGNYLVESQWASDKIMVSYLGYDSDTLPVIIGKNQRIDFEIKSSSLVMKEVVIKAKKKRYRKKNNPAVDLIRKVIKNRDKNRLEKQDYFAYDKYEKVELDLNNITEKMRNRKFLKQFQFVFENVDTSEINGKPYLPIFIQETSSKVYYRKNPKTTREHREGVQMSGLKKYWDSEGISALMDMLYQDIDIYENNINIVDVQFVSPLSIISPDFYKFYIMDTVEMQGIQCIDLAFLPRNKMNFGFRGNIFVTLDGNYTVIKLDLGITEQISMNWVDDLKIVQEFVQKDGAWILNVDKMIIDFKITKKGLGFFGRKTAIYANHTINQKPEGNVFIGTNKKVDAEDAFTKDETFWAEARPIPLTKNEAAVYQMIDTIQTIPAFNMALDALNLLSTGFFTVGPIDFGPTNGFYSFSQVEGSRIRIGGETNLKFNKKVQIQAQGLYSTRDKKFKYSGRLRYSFNKNFEDNPRHELQFAYQHDASFPGLNLNFVNEDNLLLSFKRGVTDKMIFADAYKVTYLNESESDFSYQISLENRRDRPIGNWTFNYFDVEQEQNQLLNSVNYTEAGLRLRWAPNEEFIQARDYRYPITNKYPVFTLQYNAGLKNLFDGEYNYHRVSLNLFKKFNFSFLGYAHIDVEAGKVFADGIPFTLLYLARANQTYSYQTYSYNMMNFLEFVSDEFASVNIRYYLNGFLMNKIPLLRRLKLREIVTFKMLYGRLADKNDPNLHDELIQFPTDVDGNPTTFSLEQEPYMEASVGIGNIFRVITIDLVKRLNYMENPNTPRLFGVDGLGIRFRAILEF